MCLLARWGEVPNFFYAPKEWAALAQTFPIVRDGLFWRVDKKDILGYDKQDRIIQEKE
jgi:hypothetical protein